MNPENDLDLEGRNRGEFVGSGARREGGVGGEYPEEGAELDEGGLGGETPEEGRSPTAPGGMGGEYPEQSGTTDRGGMGGTDPELDRTRVPNRSWSESRDMEDEAARRSA